MIGKMIAETVTGEEEDRQKAAHRHQVRSSARACPREPRSTPSSPAAPQPAPPHTDRASQNGAPPRFALARRAARDAHGLLSRAPLPAHDEQAWPYTLIHAHTVTAFACARRIQPSSTTTRAQFFSTLDAALSAARSSRHSLRCSRCVCHAVARRSSRCQCRSVSCACCLQLVPIPSPGASPVTSPKTRSCQSHRQRIRQLSRPVASQIASPLLAPLYSLYVSALSFHPSSRHLSLTHVVFSHMPRRRHPRPHHL